MRVVSLPDGTQETRRVVLSPADYPEVQTALAQIAWVNKQLESRE